MLSRRRSPPRHGAARAQPAAERRLLRLDASGTLRLAVVADTHSRPHPDTATRLRALAPHAILHGGDIGELAVLDELAAIAPVHAVRGNIDAPAAAVPELLLLEIAEPADPGGAAPGADVIRLRVLLLHIAVAGPRLRAEVAQRAAQEGASLVVCGHSHVPFIGRHGGVTVFNPGSVGPRRFGLPIALGWITVSGGRVTLGHIDCETGERWLPP